MILLYIQLNILVKTKKEFSFFNKCKVHSKSRCLVKFEILFISAIHINLSYFATFFIVMRAKISIVEIITHNYVNYFFLNIFIIFIFIFIIFIYLKLNKLKKINTIYTPFNNDPSAGSPTDTLLRLLLPLDNKVQMFSKKNRVSFLSIIFTGSSNR